MNDIASRRVLTGAPSPDVRADGASPALPALTGRHALAAALVAAALVVYFTWPLALHPARVGRIDNGDGQYSIWNVGWVAHALTRGDRSVFDANIFHPTRGALAFSEANVVAGVLGVPAYLMTGSAVAAHNSAVLIGLWLSMLGMAALAWRITASGAAACVAAVLFTFSPFVYSHAAHIQLLMVFGLPWALLAMHAFVDAPSVPRAAALGLAIAVQALASGYYGVLAGLAVTAGCLYYATTRRRWTNPRWWLLVGVAAAVAIVAVLPVFLPYVRLQQDLGFGRSLAESRQWSADWRAYLASSAWLHTWMLKYLGTWKEVLFPGFVSIALAAAGVVVSRRVHAWRETAGFYLVIVGLAVWCSFGPSAGLYSLLYEVLPVFSLLRAPSRFAIAVLLGLAVLSAIGAAAIGRRAGARRALVGATLCVLAVADMSTKWPAVPVPPPPAAYDTLRQLPPAPVVELPFFYISGEFFRHANYMFASTYHWRPIVNGYSDYIPPDFVDITVPLSSFPNLEGFAILRARRVRYVLIRPAWYSSQLRGPMIARLGEYARHLKPHVTDGPVWLYEIVSWPE